MKSFTVPALVIRRVYTAPPQRVYEAWTDPQIARDFLCPQGMTVGDIAMDVRVGGAYRIDMRTAENEPYVAFGNYHDVQPGRRLSMTWQWEEDNPAEQHETLLTLEFHPHGSGTEFILTHERLSSEESRQSHTNGWTSILQRLHGVYGSLVTTVDLPAAPERVFAALASEEITKWWVRPGVFDTRDWNGDVRVGGTWRASGIGGGNPYTLEGEFLEVRAPEKLVHTWHAPGTPTPATTVSYVLERSEMGTRLTLKQEGFTNAEACTNTAAGWETSFEKLRDLFEDGSTGSP